MTLYPRPKPAARRRRRGGCGGDPSDHGPDSHPWSKTGEDERGRHYECAKGCGAKTTDA